MLFFLFSPPPPSPSPSPASLHGGHLSLKLSTLSLSTWLAFGMAENKPDAFFFLQPPPPSPSPSPASLHGGHVSLKLSTGDVSMTESGCHLHWMVLGQLSTGTTPHRIKRKPNCCPPGPQSLGLLPTRTTPHQDHYQPVNPLIRTNTCTVGNCPGGELSGYGNGYEQHPALTSGSIRLPVHSSSATEDGAQMNSEQKRKSHCRLQILRRSVYNKPRRPNSTMDLRSSDDTKARKVHVQ